MFRVLNISGLMRHAFERDKKSGTIWQITQLGLAGGREESDEQWDVRLSDGTRDTLLGWQAFLDEFRVVDESAPSVRTFLSERLQALKKELIRLGKQTRKERLFKFRKPNALVAHRLWAQNDPLRCWFMPSLTVDQHDLKRSARDALQPLLQGLEYDAGRIALRAETKTAKTKITELTLSGKSAGGDFDEAQWDVLQDKISRSLEQALGGSRHLLSLTDRFNHPAGVESVLASILSGALTSFLLELASQTLKETPIHLAVGVGDAPMPSSADGERYHTEWEATVPIWSMESGSPMSIHFDCILSAGTRTDKASLNQLVGLAAELFNAWLAAREKPLANRGGGWTCLLERGDWNAEAFQRWLTESSTDEIVQRLRAVGGRPAMGPSVQEKQAGWDAALERVRASFAELTFAGWSGLMKGSPLVEGALLAEAKPILHEVAIARVKEITLPHGRALEWFELWFQSAKDDVALGGSDGRNMLDAWKGRCLKSRSEDDQQTLFDIWQRQGRSQETVFYVAEACAQSGEFGPDQVAELAGVLAETDQRRVAAAALAEGLKVVGEENVIDTKLPLAVLRQEVAEPTSWAFSPEDRQQVTKVLDAWIKKLDRTQDLEGWESVISHRKTLKEFGLYEGS